MLRHGIGAGLLLAGALTAAAQEGSKPIWSVLEKLLAQEKVSPAPFASDPAAPQSTERRFLFDETLQLEPEAFMRGAAFVLAKNTAPADPDLRPAHERRVDAQLAALFEYYPLVAQTPEDFNLLTRAIASGGEPPALRQFLLRRCIPGPATRSALGAYMQDCLAGGDPEFQAVLAAIVQNPTEVPEVQFEAARALPPLISNTFEALLARDPEAVAHRKKTGTPLHARALIDAPESIPMTRPHRLKLEEHAQIAGGVTAILLAAARDPARTPEMRAQAAESAASILAEIPVPNRQELAPRIEQRPPALPETPPAP